MRFPNSRDAAVNSLGVTVNNAIALINDRACEAERAMQDFRANFVRFVEYLTGLLAILFLYMAFLFIFDHEQMLDLIIRFIFGEPLL